MLVTSTVLMTLPLATLITTMSSRLYSPVAIAPVAGTYRVRVRSDAFTSSPCIYRLFLARPAQFYPAMPPW